MKREFHVRFCEGLRVKFPWTTRQCAGVLDVCRKLQLLDEHKYAKGRELIVRIVSILTKMAQRNN